nr:chemotaxis protein CheW [uncultured Methanospirillum sp.]
MNNQKPQLDHLDEDNVGDEIQVVEFILGDNKFAINLFDVREIVESIKITPLPHSAMHIKGIIDLRGEISTIIDLKTILNIGRINTIGQNDSRFIVLDDRVTQTKTGILVDDVTSVLTIPTSDIEQTSKDSEDNSHILGIIKKNVSDREETKKELVMWIDIHKILQDADQKVRI